MTKSAVLLDTLHGEIGNVSPHIFDMKEKYYATMIMPIYGTNQKAVDDKFRTTDGVQINFRYPKTVKTNYQKIDAGESHNKKSQAHTEHAYMWYLRLQINCVLDFLVDVLEVNANLGEHYFGGVESVRPIMEFRGILLRHLFKNLPQAR